jgi:regulator of protease activity HflC (stomatin/prohibitin superfamily)
MMEKVAAFLREAAAAMVRGAVLISGGLLAGFNAVRGLLILALVLGAAAYLLYRNPPFKTVGRGEVGLRINVFTGDVTEQREGSVLVLPVIHDLRVFPLRDQVYRPPTQRADGPSPVQSLEGLSLGADISVRYAIDPARLRAVAANLPDDIAGEIVEPAVQGVIYKTFARYTVREIFSTKRVEIQQAVETELRARFAADGLALRGVLIGKVDLPREYRRGMEALLSEELATEKMRYTLELKEKRVQEIALDGEAEKTRREKAAEALAREHVLAAKGQEEAMRYTLEVKEQHVKAMALDGEAEKTRREKTAEAAARETVIAAKAQEEAMRHVLPFKQRQIEQRTLEAEAEKVARISGAEASAQARRIEANGEALARQRLAEAEAYRLQKVGVANSEQMAREGALVSAHPLLIQKTLAEKLSDKIQVLIVPPHAQGERFGANLLGGAATRGGQ